MHLNNVTVEHIKLFHANTLMLCIDGVPLSDYITEKTQEDYNKLSLAWLSLYDALSEHYINTLLLHEINGNVPVLVCPDDLDLVCTVIVAKIRYQAGLVHWDKIGLMESYEVETLSLQRSKLKTLSHWSECYDLAKLTECDQIWQYWRAKCKSEEDSYYIWSGLHLALNNDENIKWFNISPLVFDKNNYQQCVRQVLTFEES